MRTCIGLEVLLAAAELRWQAHCGSHCEIRYPEFLKTQLSPQHVQALQAAHVILLLALHNTACPIPFLSVVH